MASTIVSEKFALLTATGTADGVVTIASNKGWLPGCSVWLNANGKNPVQCVIAAQVGATQIQLRSASGGFLNLSTYTVAGGSNLSLEQQIVAVKFFRDGAKSTSAATPAPEPEPVFYPTISAATFSNGTLSVTGTNFVSGAVASVDGANKTTTYVSATSLSVNVTGIEAGSHTVVVTNPDTKTSNTYTFTVTYPLPAPVIDSATASAGALSIAGSNFVSGCVVSVDGTDKTTTFTSSSSLSADVTGVAAGSHTVVVTNPDSKTSNSFTFSIAAAALAPVINSATFTNGVLAVTGSNFVSGCVVSVAGEQKATTFSSSTTVYADLSGIAAGTYSATVRNPDTQVSNSYSFTAAYARQADASPDLPSGNVVTTSDHWLLAISPNSVPTTGKDLVIDGLGSVYAVGEVSTPAGNREFLLVKTSSSGDLIWQRMVGGYSLEETVGVARSASGDLFVAGITESNTNLGDFAILKYDSNGVLVWQRFLSGTGTDIVSGVSTDIYGNCYVVGTAGNAGFNIAKYSNSGVLQWQKKLGGTGSQSGEAIAVDNQENVFAIGSTIGGGAAAQNAFVCKYNPSGGILWQTGIGGGGDDFFEDIALDAASNVYVCGWATTSSTGGTDIFVAKLNSSGQIQWQQMLGSSYADRGTSVFVDSSGNVYLSGIATDVSGRQSGVVAKYTNAGVLIWQRTITNTQNHYGTVQKILADGAGNVYFTGTVISTTTSQTQMLLCKLPEDGSKTGSYSGGLAYLTSSLPEKAGVLVNFTTTLPASNATLTSTTANFVDTAAVCSITKTTV